MKYIIISFTLLLMNINLKAQYAVTNTGNMQIHSGGNLVFYGNLENDGTITDNAGTVTFNGSSDQTISGTGTSSFYNLVINNSSATGVNISGGNVPVANSLTLTDGFVYTSSGNSINIADNATISGGSVTSYVIGPMSKTGNDAFTFPIGKAGYYMPIGITAPNTTTDVFTAEYFRADPKSVYGTSKDAALIKVTDNEYWTLVQNTGTTSENVTLQWNGNTSNIGNLSELRVASWNGSQWDNLGNASTTGTTSAGTMLSSTATSSYTAFTFGTTTANNPLPITLLSFDAVLNNNQVDLTWITASEVNNDFFTVEKTQDGIYYEYVATVDGAGTSNQKLYYKAIDLYPYEGLSYYRLKQTDFDGKFSYSNIVTILYGKSLEPYIYPNPFISSLNIKVNLKTYKTMVLKLYNAMGKEVLDLTLSKQLTTIETSHLPSGIYFYYILSNDKLIQSGKLISQQ